MPTYQYACTACGHELEAVQSFTDDALTLCPACERRVAAQALLRGRHRVQGLRLLPHRFPVRKVVGRLVVVQRLGLEFLVIFDVIVRFVVVGSSSSSGSSSSGSSTSTAKPAAATPAA